MKLTSHTKSSIAVCFLLSLLTATIYVGHAKKTSEKEPQRSGVQNSETWMNVFPIGQTIFCLEPDVQSPDVIYACSHRGLYKTSNGGMTWLPIFPMDIEALLFSQSKSAPNVMYLGFSYGQIGGISKSADGGTSWQRVAVEDIKRPVRSLGVDPQNADDVYVLADSVAGPVMCTGCVLYKSKNGGKTWGNITPELKVGDYPIGAPIRFVWFDPVNRGHMFVGCSRHWKHISDVAETSDGGSTWSATNYPGDSSEEDFWGYLMQHSRDNRKLLGVSHLVGDLVYHIPGAVISPDGGKSWADITIRDKAKRVARINSIIWPKTSDRLLYMGTDQGFFMSTDAGENWIKALPYATGATAEGRPGELYAATTFGVFKSSDGGKKWHEANLGLPISTGATNVLLSGSDGDDLNVGAQGGYWTSTDEGVSWSWRSIDSNLAPGISPDMSSRYGGASVRQLLIAKDKTLVLGMFLDGGTEVLKVQPDGKASQIKPGKTINRMGFSPADSQTLYVTVSEGYSSGQRLSGGTAFLKSDDGGFSWQAIDFRKWLRPTVAGFDVASIDTFVVASGSSQICDAFVRLVDGRTQTGSYALLTTWNGGASWRDVTPEQLLYAAGLTGYEIAPVMATGPKDGRQLYFASGTKMFRSLDGGVSWTQISAMMGIINDIGISPQASKTVYVASDAGMWVSRDLGITWVPLNRGLIRDSMKRVSFKRDRVFAQGNSGIYRLQTDSTWMRLRWMELEQRPESDPLAPRLLPTASAPRSKTGIRSQYTDRDSSLSQKQQFPFPARFRPGLFQFRQEQQYEENCSDLLVCSGGNRRPRLSI